MVFAPRLLPQIAAVAARHPGLPLVLDHLTLSGDIKDAALGQALKPAPALAQYPNVAVKATALPSYVTEAYPYPSRHAHIRRVVEAYGPHRLTLVHGSFGELM
jgi:predicted TIM-barrel fold metal-dependent hydrolase